MNMQVSLSDRDGAFEFHNRPTVCGHDKSIMFGSLLDEHASYSTDHMFCVLILIHKVKVRRAVTS